MKGGGLIILKGEKMGYSAYVYQVFGVRVAAAAIKKEVNTRGCSHTEVNGANFCPECGKPMWIKKTENSLESLADKGLSYYFSDHETVNRGDVILGFKLNFIGSYADKDHMAAIPELSERQRLSMWQEIQLFCNERSIAVTQEDLKYWSILYHSY